MSCSSSYLWYQKVKRRWFVVKMRPEALVPTLFLTIAWILSMVALLAGRNGQMLDLHALGTNVSKVGIDLLADSTLFNLDNSNFMYTLWNSGPNNTAPFIAAGAPGVPANSSGPSQKRDSSPASIQRRDADPRRDAKVAHISNIVLHKLLDSVADHLKVDQDSDLYRTSKDALDTLATDISKDTLACTSQLQHTVLRSLNHTFTTHPLLQSLSKRDISDADKARILLSSSHRNTPSNTSRPHSAQSSSHQPPQQSFADALAESIAAILSNSPSSANKSANPLSKLIKDNKPILASTLRATANTFLNEAVTSLRSGFAVPDWASVYQTGWCWGTYIYHGTHSAKNVSGCSDSRALEDLNLAPGIKRSLEIMDVQRDTPERVDLPGGIQRMLDGMMQFTHGVFALDVTMVALTGVVMLASAVNVAVPDRWQGWSDFLLILLCLTSGSFIMFLGAPYAFLEYLNGLVLPGMLGLLNVGYQNGWRFVGLFIGAEICTLIATGWWIVLERRGYRDRILAETETIVIGRRETGMPGMGMPFVVEGFKF